MKSQRSVFTKAATVLAFLAASQAYGSVPPDTLAVRKVVTEAAESIRFVNMEGDMLVFELRLHSVLPKGSVLRITDGDNNIIFEERTKTETYTIRYKIVRNELSKINFEVKNKEFSLNQSFNISSRLEEKIEVTKG